MENEIYVVYVESLKTGLELKLVKNVTEKKNKLLIL